eukprot:GILJ01017120.1.p1 GENE.GILJ01017120.1~~GILJ01017120.1.p1  ORF type:complete len:481 (+),score=109.12 GILJ01017120.1:53-1444(+)
MAGSQQAEVTDLQNSSSSAAAANVVQSEDPKRKRAVREVASRFMTANPRATRTETVLKDKETAKRPTTPVMSGHRRAGSMSSSTSAAATSGSVRPPSPRLSSSTGGPAANKQQRPLSAPRIARGVTPTRTLPQQADTRTGAVRERPVSTEQSSAMKRTAPMPVVAATPAPRSILNRDSLLDHTSSLRSTPSMPVKPTPLITPQSRVTPSVHSSSVMNRSATSTPLTSTKDSVVHSLSIGSAVNSTSGVPSASNKKSTQKELDVLHAMLIQAVYIYEKAKSTFQRQEQNALIALYDRWQQVTEMEKKLSEQTRRLTREKHIKRVDDLLSIQYKSLQPLELEISNVIQELNQVTVSLWSTQHGLSVGDGIKVDSNQLTQKVLHLLLTVGDMEDELTDELPLASQLQSHLESLRNTVHEEKKELETCQRLLTVFGALQNQEESLRIHSIQKRREQEMQRLAGLIDI